MTVHVDFSEKKKKKIRILSAAVVIQRLKS